MGLSKEEIEAAILQLVDQTSVEDVLDATAEVLTQKGFLGEAQLVTEAANL